jgi:inner membrane protein
MIPAPAEKRGFKGSIILKMVVIGILILVLMIPLTMVGSLVAERQGRHDQVTAEVASSWGNAQTLGGPVLVVPYHVYSRDEKGRVTTWTQLAYFLPETLKADGTLKPEQRSRGIFDVVVYNADLRLAGSFRKPSFTDWGVAPSDILWDQAYLAIGIPDMRGIRRGVELTWGKQVLPLSPGGGVEGLWTSGLRGMVPGLAAAPAGESWDFGFDLVLNGSRQIQFLPFGKQTTVTLRSSWPSPSFAGAFLPESRRVSAAGFEATWSVPYFGRSYPQQWTAPDAEKVAAQSVVDGSAFGVELFQPVDIYQKTERSVKYGLLFIVLTFLTFFLYEVFSPFALHPMQYLLVGSALCLFYVLLLSISEHVPFGLSYAIASVGTIALITGYAAAILRGRLRALGVGAALAALYGYLYVLLQAEDYALLLGSVGLFLILALVMWITRRLDWYTPKAGGAQTAPAPPPLPPLPQA